MEKKIMYVHGFQSSGCSGTVVMLRNILYETGVRVVAPDVPVSPLEAVDLLRRTAEREQPVLIIGTSMGAMYTEMLHGFPRILVNPSFHMSRTLMFKGMLGKHKFLNKRANGATEFKIDRNTIAEFAKVEEMLFSNIDDMERELVYGLFGKNDKFVNYQDEFVEHYGKEHFILFDGEHQLNDNVLKKVVLPLVKELI